MIQINIVSMFIQINKHCKYVHTNKPEVHKGTYVCTANPQPYVRTNYTYMYVCISQRWFNATKPRALHYYKPSLSWAWSVWRPRSSLVQPSQTCRAHLQLCWSVSFRHSQCPSCLPCLSPASPTQEVSEDMQYMHEKYVQRYQLLNPKLPSVDRCYWGN